MTGAISAAVGTSGLDAPRALWVFPTIMFVGYAVLLAWCILDTARNRRLSIVTLGLLAGTTMWWAEWFGDWGAYLLYSPRYQLLWWHQSTWTTPNKPLFMIAAYGVYYAVAIPIGLALVNRIRRWRPSWPAAVTLLLIVPYFFMEDAIIEYPATHLGWWTYVNPIGPTIGSSRGVFPFLYPMVFTTIFVLTGCWLIDRYDANGRRVFEVRLGVERLKEGWRREIGRLASWVGVLNVTYLVTLIGPLVVLRLAFGPQKSLVPG